MARPLRQRSRAATSPKVGGLDSPRKVHGFAKTLGHIAGVHYVAMYAARQLEALKVPIDLGMVSGAAAGHDLSLIHI